MADKIRKWKDQAAAALRKSKYDKALTLFRQVVEQDPEDFSGHNNIGYILRRLKRTDEAVKVFEDLAEAYAERGFLLKAIATCKVVLDIDPEHKKIQTQLADLYGRRSGGAPKAEVKVMAPLEGNVQVGDEVLVPLAPIELDTAGPTLDVQTSTPLDDVTEMQAEDEPPAIEFVPLDPSLITLEPEPEPEPQAAPRTEPVEADPEERAGPSMDLDLSDLETVEDLQSRPREERTLPEIPLFSDLEPDAFVAVLEDMRVVRMKPGDWVIREGEEGSSMFVIASGAARVLKKLKGTRMLQLAVLGEGAFFGEMSVLRGGPRGASVQSVQPGELFEISKQVIDKIIGQYPSVEQVLTKFIRQRLLRNVISTSELFRPFNKEERLRIIERFVSRDIGRGELLIEEGRESNGFYILMRGRLDVLCKLDDGFTTVVGELLEGEVFGEISCLRKEPAMATVRASTPASILRLPRTDFDALILGNPQILELVNSLGEQRRAITVNALAKKGILI
jgi:CRP-like cAMP-binding protein